jgi:hypothetical protein
MTKQRKFYFVLVSEDKDNKLYPNSFRGKELGDFLRMLDEMVSSSIKGHLGEDCGGLRVEGISKGSTCIVCPANKNQYAAFTSISNEIATGNYSGKTKQHIDKIRNFGTNHTARLEFRLQKRGPAVASLVPTTRKQPITPPLTIDTDTTLYGKISGINGVSRIKVTLSLVGYNGNVDFIVSSKDDIKEFCSRFGEIVGVNGQATILLPQREVASFSFSSLTRYHETPIFESVELLREKFGPCFNALDDIDSLIREQRG